MSDASNASSRKLIAVWSAASIVWLASVAWQAWVSWPVMPLDVSPNDAATRAAFDAAATAHVTQAALIGLGVPVAVYAIGWLVCRVRGN